MAERERQERVYIYIFCGGGGRGAAVLDAYAGEYSREHRGSRGMGVSLRREGLEVVGLEVLGMGWGGWGLGVGSWGLGIGE